MGSVYYPNVVGFCLILLLLVSFSAAEPFPQKENNTSPFFGSGIDELNNSNILTKTPESVLESFSLLQKQLSTDGQYGKAAPGTGWENVSMPVVITAPGMYRINNDYTAEREEIGVSILASDVFVDGNGHTFTGLSGYKSYGAGMSQEDGLSNITITNFSTRECTAGVVFEHGSGINISDTHHAKVIYGIAGGPAQNVVISNNTVTGYPITDEPEIITGITIMQGTGVRIEDNRISNLQSDREWSDSTGITLLQSDDLHLLRNEITGPISTGISSTALSPEDTISCDVSDNRISDARLLGMYIEGGVGEVRNNSVVNGTVGISLTMDNTAVLNNTVRGTTQRGLALRGTNMTLSGNILSANACNLYIEGEDEAAFLHQIDRTNLLDDRPLIYLRDQNNVTIGPADNPAMVLAVRSQNLTIHDVTPGNAMAGIVLINSSDISVFGVRDTGSVNGILASNVNQCSLQNTSAYNNSIYGFIVRSSNDVSLDWCHTSGSSGNAFYLFNSQDVVVNASYSHVFTPPYREEDACGMNIDSCRNVSILNSIFSESPNSGISVTNSEQVLVKKAHLTENQDHGITLMQCTDSSIEESLVQNNREIGIDLSFITGFSIRRNLIENNTVAGLRFLDAANGTIFDNLFNNSLNVGFVWGSTPLVWNTTFTPGDNVVHGPTLGGNFWASPDGQGFSEVHADRGDGICNVSYVLNSNNSDYLPLAIPSEEIIARFSADPVSGVPPLTVRFSDLSSGYPDSWKWTFGDGTASSEQNPVHTYTGIGRFTVTLEASGEQSQDIVRKSAYITVHPGKNAGPAGMIMVNSTPPNGSVFLDGSMIGYTPLNNTVVPVGTYQVVITHDGYQNWSRTVFVRQGQSTLVPTAVLRKG